MSKETELKFYIGIDNGVTGSIGIVGKDLTYYNMVKTPVISGQDYTKAKKNISRVDVKVLAEIIADLQEHAPCVAIVERPMKNPARFEATCSAMRALEAELTVLELYQVPYILWIPRNGKGHYCQRGLQVHRNLKRLLWI